MAKYRVVRRGTPRLGTWPVLFETDHLPTAKRVARNQGHTGTIHRKSYLNVAVVKVHKPDNLMGQNYYELLYTPCFLIGKDDDFKPKPGAMGEENEKT